MICIFATFLCGAFCDEAVETKQKLTVSKIKVYLDDNELTEENDGRIKRETILSFTSLKTDKEFSEAVLDREIRQTELRLMNSGLFYNAKVEKMASRKNPGTYIIYITVTTGFLKRYGGGGIYAVFGDAALNGNRDQLLWFIGYNKNGLNYQNYNTFGKPFVFGGDLTTDVPCSLVEKTGAGVNAKLTLGGMITPDFRLCVDTAAGFNFGNLAFNENLTISPYFCGTKFITQNLFWTSEIRCNIYPLLEWNKYCDAAFTVNYKPFRKLTIAALAAGGYSFGDSGNQIRLYRSEENLTANVGLANREIRSGYTPEELTVNNYVMATLEIRYRAFEFSLPPCFPTNMQPYVFADAAYTDFTGSKKVMDAFGTGLYWNFDCPVFVTFNFSYGYNHEGKGRFSFACMSSF